MTDLPDSQKLYPENTNPEETKQENEPADLDHRKGKGSRHPTLNTQFTGNSQRDGLKVDKRTDDVYNVHASSGQNISKLPKKPLVDSEEILKIQDIKQKTCENKGSKKVNIGTNDENAITGTEKDLANNRNMAKDTPACDTRLHNENREFRISTSLLEIEEAKISQYLHRNPS